MSEFHGEYNIVDYRSPVIAYFDIELDDAMLSPYAARAYMRIARRCAGGNRQCTESVANMATGCRMSERKMYDALKELASRKMIIMDSRPGTTSVIGLLDKESWLPFEATPALNAEVTPAPRAEGVCTTCRGGLHTVQTKNTNQVHTKREGGEEKTSPRATSSPEEPKAIVEGLGETLEDLYPGHATNWKMMRELQELVHRVSGTIIQVKAFDNWLKAKYPMKANTPFTFKDLFPVMVKESATTSSASKPKAKYCGECNSGWMMNAQGEAFPCKCQK